MKPTMVSMASWPCVLTIGLVVLGAGPGAAQQRLDVLTQKLHHHFIKFLRIF